MLIVVHREIVCEGLSGSGAPIGEAIQSLDSVVSGDVLQQASTVGEIEADIRPDLKRYGRELKLIEMGIAIVWFHDI
jgi:hypothetical protein